MSLWEFEGKKVRLVSKETGRVFEGLASDYIHPDDNEPEEVEGIVLDFPTRNDGFKYQNPVQFNAPEIKSIEVIS